MNCVVFVATRWFVMGEDNMKEEILNAIKKSEKLAYELQQMLSSLHISMQCQNEITVEEQVEDALLYVVNDHDYDFDIEDEHVILHDEETYEERKIFFAGIKYGYENSLFWLADYFGLQDFHEEKIRPVIRKSKEEK